MRREISNTDSNYPGLLKMIDRSPKRLFIRCHDKCDLDLLFESPKVCIVGSRKASEYGKRVAHHIVKSLVSSGVVVVSGFMSGIDTYAHDYTVQEKGKTIAVMPCGADVVIPAVNHALYQKVLESEGCFISEYEWGTKPRRWFFPDRNRIVAGISDVVIVVEAAENSGSLITAKYGFEYGKKVFAVPGSIFSEVSTGTNWLLGRGAIAMQSPRDILKELSLDLPLFNINKRTNTEEASSILKLLEFSSLSFSELTDLCDLDLESLTLTLIELESTKRVIMKEGKYHVC